MDSAFEMCPDCRKLHFRFEGCPLKNKESDTMPWEKQEGNQNLWLPKEKNEELVGIVTAIEEGKYGMQCTIKKEDGSEATTPSHKVLQSRMDKVKKDDKVKIVFTGVEPPAVKGQNPMKMYEVFIDRPE